MIFRGLKIAAFSFLLISSNAIAATPAPVSVTDPGGVNQATVDANGQLHVYAVPGYVTQTAALTSSVATGGTAVTLFKGPIHGCYVTNPLNAAAQGIAVAENAYVDPYATPGSNDATANGTTLALVPGQSYSCPPFASGSFMANAATSGHKLTVVVW